LGEDGRTRAYRGFNAMATVVHYEHKQEVTQNVEMGLLL